MNIATFPSFDYLQLMKSVIDIEFKLAGEQKGVWLFIKQAIQMKEPARDIINTVKNMAEDNYNAVADVLGVKLTNRILYL